ncbi:VQ motif-containing protein 25-like [Senna tora]|uniref:VQ motif-containing protein 25-like n=1 Tax=Senna tora TaxID=362788 RepID=A0A834X1P3_9FABA|nr:VQ motif-containing protein 25-like [Senna tora]
MTKPYTSFPNSSPNSSSSKLGIDHNNRGSHNMISKLKPTKIRIVHIYAPEIIQTDAANFRELVQRLTGNKQPEEDESKIPSITKDVILEKEKEFLGMKNGERIKNEEEDDEIWRRAKPNHHERFSGFFDGFSELDGFYGILINLLLKIEELVLDSPLERL